MNESILATTRDALYELDQPRAAGEEAGEPASLLSMYFFDHGYPAEDEAGLHGFHASELPFVFGCYGPARRRFRPRFP